ncbi:MAG: hypothetical protein GXP39_08055 [Chloroflexi bacterium]|nr:hypothetical protein [Chloroflexota bacterium]
MDAISIPVERIIAVCVSLAAFGIAYNAMVEYLEREVPEHGYTSFLVVGGVMVTLIGAAFIVGLIPALLVSLCFIASGLPMIIGSVWRWLRQRRIDRSLSIREMIEALDDDA